MGGGSGFISIGNGSADLRSNSNRDSFHLIDTNALSPEKGIPNAPNTLNETSDISLDYHDRK